MGPPSLDSAEILSLDALQINLPQDVYIHLAAQYSVLDGSDETASPVSTQSPHVDKILGRMKTSPADTCCRVNLIEASVEEVVDGLRDHISISEVQGLSYDIQRHETIEDLVIIRANPKQSNTADGMLQLQRSRVPPNPDGKNIFPNWPARADKGWPMSHRAVIVDRLCGEAVMRGANVFVRGILCADAGIATGEEIAVYADLRGLNSKNVPRGLLLESYSGRCVFLGMGTSRCKRSDYFSQSAGLGVGMLRTAGPSQPSLNAVLPGKMMMQNLPSVCVAHALDPRPGEVVLDMCCAPGGKTTHLASLMKNEGTIVACDKIRKKMLSARDFFRSMDATCIVPLALDSTKSLLKLEDGESWRSPRDIIDSASAATEGGMLDVKGFYANSFDRILLDPPCSALGLRPKLIIDTKSSKALSKFAEYQRRFVRNAVHMLKPGGTMTYSTCTINAEENEDMVKYILSEFPLMKLVPIGAELPGLPGLAGRGLADEECRMVRRFDPCDMDTMGFFLAKFVRLSWT